MHAYKMVPVLGLVLLAGCSNELNNADGGCLAPMVICGGTCTDLQSNDANCGSCGSPCAAGLSCMTGICVGQCPTDEQMCGNACAKIATDSANCGACGNTCDSGQVCSFGDCTAQCAAPLATCEPESGARYCADLWNDAANCRTCGNACASDQVCENGACVAGICGGPRKRMCSGVCADIETDHENCGACGNSCASGICQLGHCVSLFGFPGPPSLSVPNMVSVASGDIDSDGSVDLVFSTYGWSGPPQIEVLRNLKGKLPAFSQDNYQLNMQPAALTLADLNSDGRMDIVMAAQDSVSSVYGYAVYVFWQKPDHTFNLQDPFDPEHPENGGRTVYLAFQYGSPSLSNSDIASGDFNNDGKPDIALTLPEAGKVAVMLGTGSGLGAAVVFSSPGVPFRLALADMNADGALDIVVAHQNSTVSVALNNTQAPGTSFNDVAYGTGQNCSIGAIAVGDVTGDGRPDVGVTCQPLTSSESDVRVLPQSASGSFGPPTMAIEHIKGGPSLPSLAILDINGDQALDLVALNGNWQGSLISALNDPLNLGHFSPATSYLADAGPRRFTVGDFNGDGLSDLAFGGQFHASIVLGGPAGLLATVGMPSAKSNPGAIAVGDLDGDGLADIVVGGTSIYFNQAAAPGTFTRPADYPMENMAGTPSASLTIADINGDGFNDVILGSEGRLLMNRPSHPGTFDYSFLPLAGYVAAGALNQDGFVDLVIVDQQMAHVLLNQASHPGTFADTSFTVTAGVPLGVALADLDGDGAQDMVFAVPNFGIEVRLSDGAPNPTFADCVAGETVPRCADYALPTQQFVGIPVIADFNGDGKPDIALVTAVANQSYWGVSVSLNRIATPGVLTADSFDPPQVYPAALVSPTFGLVAADMNGDGKPDLIAGNGYGDNNVNILLNQASAIGPLTAESFISSFYPTSANNGALAIGDMDGDGFNDIVVNCYPLSMVSVLHATGY